MIRELEMPEFSKRVALGIEYGSEGIEPLEYHNGEYSDCFSCIGSSGNTICGAFCGYESLSKTLENKGLFLVFCAYNSCKDLL